MLHGDMHKVSIPDDPSDLRLLLEGWGVSTVEVFFRIPDYQSVLNSLVVQMMDIEPDYPKLFSFIDFWKANIDGPIHSVRFTHCRLLSGRSWSHVVQEVTIP